ncbi:MAG TPA: ATP-dependent DNA ligase [Candidatus Norongarragalinales archaeon]|jgi:DNA ligase-1|nr:ATP-dependent DNA ligase [Candidatus Norongarragalinales archaeon]
MDFSEVVKVFDEIERTPGRLKTTELLAELYKRVSTQEIKPLVYLTQGRIAPAAVGIELGMGEKLAQEAIARVTGRNVGEVVKLYRKKGDLGETAEEFMKEKKQHALARGTLTIKNVYERFYKIATASGSGSQDTKIGTLSQLLSDASPSEARFVVRFVTGKLRMGVGEPTIIDALLFAKTGSKEQRVLAERAFNLTGDLGEIAENFWKEGTKSFEKTSPEPFRPIAPALAERLPSSKEIIEKLGKCAVEAKYDGLRLQVHKKGDKVIIFSRRSEPMTNAFPDIVEATRKQIAAKEAIFEGEAIGFNENEDTFLPFQETIKRRRKLGVKEKAEEIPLKLFAFDLLYADGKDYTHLSYKERRAALEKVIKKGDTIEPGSYIIADKPEQLDKFFDEKVGAGLEGIIAKDLNAPYTAGARKFAWIKLKRSYKGELADTLDVVIIGYYRGRGKRTKFEFGGLLTAVYDEKEDKFKSIAKIGTGFNEKQMQEFHDLLSKISSREKPANVDSRLVPDFWVLPKHVVVVRADEITKSPTHTAGASKKDGEGFALRFPRIIQNRFDKAPRDATSVKEVLRMYENQRKTPLSTGYGAEK